MNLTITSRHRAGAALRGKEHIIKIMTDKQYDGILQMIGMILDGCRDIDEARRKIESLRDGTKERKETETSD